MTANEAAELISYMCVLYPRRLGTNEQRALAALWHSALREEDAKEIWESVIEYIRTDTSGFMPLPGRVLEIAQSRRAKKHGSELQKIFMQSIAPDSGEAREPAQEAPPSAHDIRN